MDTIQKFWTKTTTSCYDNLWVPLVKWTMDRGYLPPDDTDWRRFYSDKHVKYIDRGVITLTWGGRGLYRCMLYLLGIIMKIYVQIQISHDKYSKIQESIESQGSRISSICVRKPGIESIEILHEFSESKQITKELYADEIENTLYYVFFTENIDGKNNNGILVTNQINKDTQKLLTIDTKKHVLSAEIESEGITADVTYLINLYVGVSNNKSHLKMLDRIYYEYKFNSPLFDSKDDCLRVIHSDASMGEYKSVDDLDKFW